jgi:hypothetical protein
MAKAVARMRCSKVPRPASANAVATTAPSAAVTHSAAMYVRFVMRR